MSMFRSVLVANRGEIARRVFATARRLNIETVAVFSEADRDAAHVRDADKAVLIGPAAARDSYLKGDRVIAAAKASGAEAIHPGYGFLSENADFAEAVEAAGIVFIGPKAASMRKMGSKAGAKDLMQAAGVPVVPGYTGDDQSPQVLAREAARIGFPLMIKAAAGGGGRGIRVITNDADLADAYERTSQEALRAFGSGVVFLERLVTGARHVEVQVIADGQGTAWALGVRDCSLQRRNQKVIEESPAPGITDEQREEIGELCVEACKRIGYRGAGTFEFLYDAGRFYFIEMNTRIQVEHPVTEMVTGVDLIREMIRIADGKKLTKKQGNIRLRGHAIECRINAENARTFAPSPGEIKKYHAPGGPGVRLDSHCYTGYRVPPHYDSMIGKLIVWGPSRASAISRMNQALAEMIIEGINVNIPLQRRIMADPIYQAGTHHIHYMEHMLEEWAAEE